MAKKLYEWSALLRCQLVIAADTEAEAREEIKTYEKAWVTLRDCPPEVFDIELVDVRDPKPGDLKDEAHVVVH